MKIRVEAAPSGHREIEVEGATMTGAWTAIGQAIPRGWKIIHGTIEVDDVEAEGLCEACGMPIVGERYNRDEDGIIWHYKCPVKEGRP